MIRILEVEDVSYSELLSKQGYTYKSLFDFVIKIITDYYKYPGISLAYEEYNYRKEINNFVKDFVDDYIIPKVIEIGNTKRDYSEIFEDCVEENSNRIKSFELKYKFLLDKTYGDWQEEVDDLLNNN